MNDLNTPRSPPAQSKNEQLAAILKASYDAIVSVGMDRAIQTWNPSATRFFGYTETEALGQNIDYLLVPEHLRGEVLQHYPVELSFKQPHLHDTVRCHKDGSMVAVELSLSPIVDSSGKVCAISAIYRSISERKKIEQELHAISEKLQLGISVAGFGLGKIDYISNTVTLDTIAADLFSLPSNLPIPRSELHARFHPDEIERISASIIENLDPNGAGFIAINHRIVRHDGTTRWVSARKQEKFEIVSANDSKIPVSGLLALRDITERVEAEVALLKSEAFNRGVLEGSPDCIKVLDRTGRLEFMNENGRELMEISDFSDFDGVDFSSFWPADSRETVTIAIEAAQRGEKFRFESFCATTKGTPKWWDIVLNPILDSQGQTSHIIASSRDITERKQVEDALAESQARLNHAADTAGLTYFEVDFQLQQLKMADNYSRIMGYTPPIQSNHPQDVTEGATHFLAHIVPQDRLRVETSLNEFVASMVSGKVQYRLRGDDNVERYFESVWSMEEGPDGKPAKSFTTNRDITESKRIEEHNKLLMAEVNHRTKNLLGVIQAVARQTATGGDPVTFVQRLSERISGLAFIQDLLVKNAWRGVEMSEMVEVQLAHFKDLVGTRVLVNGPAAQLTAASAQGIGMALHELSTNAAKYGALSNQEGRVHISWDIIDGTKPMFEMLWREEGGPLVAAPTQHGFGQKVIGRMVEAAVQGDTEIMYKQSGLSWKLRAPVETALETANVFDRAS